jgi:hypothetical protein
VWEWGRGGRSGDGAGKKGAEIIPARVPFLVDGNYLIQMENTYFSESYRLGSTRILDYSIRADAFTRL